MKIQKSRRYIALLWMLVTVSLMMNISGSAAQSVGGVFTVRLSENFENTVVSPEYTSSLTGIGASFIGEGSRIMAVSGAQSITGYRSLQINECDIRWWSLNIEDEVFRFGFSVKIDRSFDNDFRYAISTQDAATGTEGLGGSIVSIKNNESDATILYGYDMTEITELKKDTVYRIELTVSRGSDIVTVSINGEQSDRTFRFASAIYNVTGLRINVTDVSQPMTTDSTSTAASTSQSGTDASSQETTDPTATATPTPSDDGDIPFLTIDEIFISSQGRTFPQQYSAQAPGDIPEISLPAATDKSQLRVFVNTTQIGMSKSYTTEATVYISAEQFFKSIGIEYNYDKDEKVLTVKNSKVDVSVAVPGSSAYINQTLVELSNPVRMIDNVIMISPNFINEVFNAKVWWDQSENILVITTGTQKSDDILRKIGNKLYMNGEPYYEISFNKFDLFLQIIAAEGEDVLYPTAEFQTAAAEAALSQLHDLGFKSIRVFCGSNLIPNIMYDDVAMGKYLEAMDVMFDLCDKYDIKVVVCMTLLSDNFVAKEQATGYGWVNKNEGIVDLVANPQSESRAVLKRYIEKFVTRYKDRKTVLMYEIVNEGNLEADVGYATKTVRFSLSQLGEFYTDCANTIRSFDSQRLVTGGDAILRGAQWNLFEGTMNALGHDNWQTDTLAQRLNAIWLLNSGLDVISVHTYGIGNVAEGVENTDAVYIDENGDVASYGFDLLMSEAERLGKPLYNGETAGTMDTEITDYTDINKAYLESIITNGVQLSHWWTFRSDRQGFDDPYSWRVDSGELLDTIVIANEKLQEVYVINNAQDENTNVIWQDSNIDIFDPTHVIGSAAPPRATSTRDALIRFGLLAAILVGGAAVVFVIIRRRKAS